MTEDVIKKAKRNLYLNMLTYTKGEAHTKTISGGIPEVFETYRNITQKGNNANIRTLMERRQKVTNPEPAK